MTFPADAAREKVARCWLPGTLLMPLRLSSAKDLRARAGRFAIIGAARRIRFYCNHQAPQRSTRIS